MAHPDGNESHIPLLYQRPKPDEIVRRGQELYRVIETRRSVRQFSSDPVPREAIEWAVRIAGRAPSGANQQPWRFVVISDPVVKRRIRQGAETVEREFYQRRITEKWSEALEPLGTDWQKPHLEQAPYLIAVFVVAHGVDPDGERVKHYYTNESVGLACGFLLSALHQQGLCTLTHTPSPMGFVAEILERPANERPFMLIPVGYAATDAQVPAITKKPLDEILVRVEGRELGSEAQ